MDIQLVVGISSVIAALLAVFMKERGDRRREKKERIAEVAEQYMDNRSVAAGLEGLQHAGVITLQNDAEIRELADRIIGHGENDPLQRDTIPAIDHLDLKAFFDRVARERVRLVQSPELTEFIGLIVAEQLPTERRPRRLISTWATWSTRQRVAVIGVTAGLLIFGAYGLGSLFRFTTAPPPHVYAKRAAVLPFTNMSADPEYEYFSDGVTEDILTELVKIGDLRVISRATMMQYKGSQKTLSEIGRELDVAVILEGSVRKDEDRVRITAQLIDANTDEHIWAENYDRELEQVFAIQSEIAQKIAEALHAQLSSSERQQLEKRISSNPEAYNLFLQGKYAIARGGSEDVSIAIDKYEQALSIEPNNARVWAALATAYARQADIGVVPTFEGYAKAREAAEKALSIDDELPYGHVAMGMVKSSYDWDWQGAEVEYRKALELAPGNAIIIDSMANLLMTLGRADEAIALARKASDLDPVGLIRYKNLGLKLMFTDRLDEAATAFTKVIELNPQYPTSHAFLGQVYLLQGRPEMAIAEINKETDEAWRLFGLSLAYHRSGRKADADSTLEILIDEYGKDSPFQIAEVYAYRGDKDRAFEWLDRAYALRDGGLSSLKGDPLLRNIEGDPRYAAFMRRMNLPI